MTAWRRRIPKCWFGYQVKETEAYLRKLESMQRLEADEIECKLKDQRAVNDQLKTKMEEMTSKAHAVPLPSDKTSLLLERLERSVEAIKRQGAAETESLRRLQERNREHHYRRMNEWDKQFEEYRNALDFLLEESAALISKLKDKQQPETIGRLEREAEEAMQVVPEWMHEAAVAHQAEAGEESEESAHQAEAGASAKILHFKLRSILGQVAATDERFRTPSASITADGMSVGEGESTEPAANPTAKRKAAAAPTSFWGDLKPYFEEDEPQTSFMLQREDDADIPEPGILLPETERHFGEILQQAGTPGVKFPDVRATVSQSTLESPGLSEEILSIQNRYIVGKAAGENLYAPDGRLIIAKGRVITADVVHMAEREGKLPDLIVHMVIPGFGEEQS